MFWKGPIFTRDGFRELGLNLESCEIIDSVDGEEDGKWASYYESGKVFLEQRSLLPAFFGKILKQILQLYLM